MKSAPWLDADEQLSPEAIRRAARIAAHRWLLLVAIASLTVGGIIGRWGFQNLPEPTPVLALPSGWGQACTPVAATAPTAIPTPLRVYVSGAVAAPQVLTLTAGSLVADALTAAGGPAPDANLNDINLAAPLVNHQQINVPSRATPAPIATPKPQTTASETSGTLININTATTAELELLPRIGPAMAQRILDYREVHGPFQTVEDLLNIAGIGPATLEQLRPHVTLVP